MSAPICKETALLRPTMLSPDSSSGTSLHSLSEASGEDLSHQKRHDSALKSFLSGSFAGICVVLVGHPLDLAKVRMQTRTGGVGTSSSGSSVGRLLVDTIHKEGAQGLYRGASAPLALNAVNLGVSFWGYDMGKRVVRYFKEEILHHHHHHRTLGTKERSLTIPELAVAGGLSAIPSTFLVTPAERIKCLLQVQQGAGAVPFSSSSSQTASSKSNITTKYRGMIDCAMQLYAQGGVRSLYQGFLITAAREIVGGVVWFATYEYLKRMLLRRERAGKHDGGFVSVSSSSHNDDKEELSPFAILTAGGIAGMVTWPVMMPADVIKSRVQVATAVVVVAEEQKSAGTRATTNGASGKRSAILLRDVIRDFVRTEGYGGFFKGLRPALIRAFPANAACFFGMEVSRKALSHVMD